MSEVFKLWQNVTETNTESISRANAPASPEKCRSRQKEKLLAQASVAHTQHNRFAFYLSLEPPVVSLPNVVHHSHIVCSRLVITKASFKTCVAIEQIV
jgi:hypothetical protein